MNIYENIPKTLDEEEIKQIASFKDVRIERIISTGQTSDWYDQDEDEWVCLLQGEAVLEFEDSAKKKLRAGDTIFLKAHLKHRVAHTSSNPQCIWLCVFSK